MIPTPEPGIYHGVSMDVYRQWDAVNSSFLWRLSRQSPRHAQYEREHPSDPTPAQQFGTLAHLAILEPNRFKDEVITLPSDAPRRPSERQRNARNPSESSIESINFWDEWEEKSRGKLVATSDTMTELLEIERAVRVQICSGLVTGGESEICLVWIDRDTGVKCKGRLDYLISGWDTEILDLKTTEDASFIAFQNDIYRYGYYQQSAFYLDGFEAITGVRPRAFVWLAVEKEAPYIAKAWETESDSYDVVLPGQAKYSEALEIYARCLETGEWPAYGDERSPIGLSWSAMRREGFDPMRARTE